MESKAGWFYIKIMLCKIRTWKVSLASANECSTVHISWRTSSRLLWVQMIALTWICRRSQEIHFCCEVEVTERDKRSDLKSIINHGVHHQIVLEVLSRTSISPKKDKSWVFVPSVLYMNMCPTSRFWNTLMFWTRSLINISAHATPVNLSPEVWIGRQADRTMPGK